MAAFRQIRDLTVGFAIPVTALWLPVAAIYLVGWRPGGEFGTILEAASFFAYVLGAIVLFGSMGLALPMFVVARWLHPLPSPVIVGTVAGIAVSMMFFAGGIPAAPYLGPFGIPVTLFGGGALVGLTLAIGLALFKRVRTVA